MNVHPFCASAIKTGGRLSWHSGAGSCRSLSTTADKSASSWIAWDTCCTQIWQQSMNHPVDACYSCWLLVTILRVIIHRQNLGDVSWNQFNHLTERILWTLLRFWQQRQTSKRKGPEQKYNFCCLSKKSKGRKQKKNLLYIFVQEVQRPKKNEKQESYW